MDVAGPRIRAFFDHMESEEVKIGLQHIHANCGASLLPGTRMLVHGRDTSRIGLPVPKSPFEREAVPVISLRGITCYSSQDHQHTV